MAEKRPGNLTQFIHVNTKDFRQKFTQKYTPQSTNYQIKIYASLIDCYQRYMTPGVIEALDSDAMVNYFTCYKQVLRGTKNRNKKLYDQSLEIEKKLKHCIQVKSNFSSNNFDFEQHRRECIQDYEEKYNNLYHQFYTESPTVPTVVKEPSP